MKATLKTRFLGIPLYEWLLIALGASALAVLLARAGGGPQFSDELWYMDLGINPSKDYQVMNYYLHIYLQKPFLELASRPLNGARLYWAFTVSLSAALTYLCARWLARDGNTAQPLLALIIFFSFSIFPQWAGATKVDFTAMLMAALFCAVYILTARGLLRRDRALFLLGFLLVLCLKSKETALCVVVLLAGFGYADDGRFSFKQLCSGWKPFIAGLAAGLGFFMMLNALILGDALWGIRPADWAAYARVTTQTGQPVAEPLNWYAEGVGAFLFAPFLLYVIAGARARALNRPPAERLLWLPPLALIAFLTLVFISNGYKTETRFILPALPLLGALGAQAFDLGETQTRAGALKTAGIFALAAVLTGVLALLFSRLRLFGGWGWPEYFYSLVLPLALSALLAFYFLSGSGARQSALVLLCLLLAFAPEAAANLKSMLIDRPNARLLADKVYPFAAFADDLTFSPETRIYISPGIPARMQMLMHRTEELRSLFNLYFDVNANFENFIFPAQFEPYTRAFTYTEPADTLAEMRYDQAVILLRDWEVLQQRPAQAAAVNAAYAFKADRHNTLVYLHRK